MAISNGVIVLRWLPPRSNGSRIRRYQVLRRRIRRYDDSDDMSEPGDGNDLAFHDDSDSSSDDDQAAVDEKWVRACDDILPGSLHSATSARVLRMAQDAFGPGSVLSMADVSGFCTAPPGAQQSRNERAGGRSSQLVLALCEGLLPLTTHEFKVRAQNDVGWSEWSDVGEPVTTRGAWRASSQNGAPGSRVFSPLCVLLVQSLSRLPLANPPSVAARTR